MNKKSFANIILIVVIVILLSTVGYFVFLKKSAPILQQTPMPITSQNNQANLKTYKSDEYGFEFKYPTWLYPISSPDSAGTQVFFVEETTLNRYPAGYDPGKAADAKFEILMDNSGAFLTKSRFDEYYNAPDNTMVKKYGDLKLRSYKVGDYNAVEYGYDEQTKARELEENTKALNRGASVGMVYFPKGLMVSKEGTIIEISTSVYRENFKTVFDQILSTFIFTK